MHFTFMTADGQSRCIFCFFSFQHGLRFMQPQSRGRMAEGHLFTRNGFKEIC